jgi:fatty acid desaturase
MGAQTSRVKLPDEAIAWYRTPLPPEVSKRLHELSDAKAAVQTLGFLGCLLGSGGLALHFAAAGAPLAALACVLLYGLQANFLINAMHELGHGFVFKTRWLNGFFLRVVSFLGWLHPDMFFSSHLRHHRYTQNAPLDQENPMREEGVTLASLTSPQAEPPNFLGVYRVILHPLRAMHTK